MKRMEVRCCCTPKKLLGTLPVPDGHGFDVPFVVMKPRNRSIQAMQERGRQGVGIDRVTLTVTGWVDLQCSAANGEVSRVEGIALKADGVSIETLRLIPGFIEETA